MGGLKIPGVGGPQLLEDSLVHSFSKLRIPRPKDSMRPTETAAYARGCERPGAFFKHELV